MNNPSPGFTPADHKGIRPNTRSSVQADGAHLGSELADILRLVLKHWKLMLLVLLAVALSALAYVETAVPMWQSTATVKLPVADTTGDPMEQLLQMNSANDPVETYMEVAKSLNVALRVARDLDLTNTAQFGGAKDLTAVAGALINSFSVTTVEGSNILSFRVQASDRRLAARLANAWAQAFIDVNLDFNRTGADSRRNFIESQMAALKVTLTNGEEALTKLAQHQGVLHQAGGETQDQGESLIAELQMKAEDLEIERSTLATRYSPNNPRYKEVDAEYREAERELQRRMLQMPTQEMDYSRLAREVKANEAMYDLLLEKDQETRISENVDDSGIVVVDTALPANTPFSPQKKRIVLLGLLVGLLLSFSAAWSLERWLDQVGGEAELFRLSGLPALAMIPNWRYELKSTQAAGAKQKAGGPSEEGLPQQEMEGLIIMPSLKNTYYSESFKMLRTNLAFSQVDRPIKTFCVLSANASEGKTTINSNLALTLAATGKKVLLVDGDLRKPRLHKLFGLKVGSDVGLPFLLNGQATLESQLRQGPVPELSILPCGVIVPNPSELMASAILEKILQTMRERFDYVIFDAAPILPVTDGVVLATRLDGVALVVKHEGTRRLELRVALEHLASAKAPVLGTILNSVDMRKYSYTYGYKSQSYGD
ncbi:MAG TPA: polysaccharide biosynthesis tyrosine autokinase [bacterium]|nr:polysaccharide biosynthesis tyrosine autokinase [bacterium]